ncbi:Rieske 2Fe-2S domain-containing protein [Massilia suwonensis]|uniref:Rieske 2Fe-2S domain-containing protein n=1 Tax=Massilia suwonensis TaxID=648895 RepID=A0ABW0MLW3_9BURK
MTSGQWWIVALSEQLAPGKTLAAVCNGRQLALFRNSAGEAFALEDRCPHRRVPLSPGQVRYDGLQCPYHGWTFDGASGRCTDIPNLRRDEKIPPAAVAAYPVAELNGFIHVLAGEGEGEGATLPGAAYRAGGREYTGTAVVGLGFGHYLDLMLDGPQCLLGFPGVAVTDFFMGDPRLDDGYLVLDRGAVWAGKGIGPAFVRDHPLLLRTRVPLAGGNITAELLDADEQPLVTVFIAAGANLRGTTSLAWRGFAHARAAGGPLGWRLRRLAGRAPFSVTQAIDARAVALVEAAPSRERSGAAARTIPIVSISAAAGCNGARAQQENVP